MAPPGTSDSVTAKSQHSNADEAEGNDLKNNFMKVIEALEEEIKNSLKEIEEKTNKNWKKSINHLKKTRKAIKQVKETDQDLTSEIYNKENANQGKSGNGKAE